MNSKASSNKGEGQLKSIYQWLSSPEFCQWIFKDNANPIVGLRCIRYRGSASVDPLIKHYNSLVKLVEDEGTERLSAPSRFLMPLFQNAVPSLPIPAPIPPPRRALIPIDLNRFLSEEIPSSCWHIYRGWNALPLPNAIKGRLESNLSPSATVEQILLDKLLMNFNPFLPENYYYQQKVNKKASNASEKYDELSLLELELIQLACLETFPVEAKKQLEHLKGSAMTDNEGLEQSVTDEYLKAMNPQPKRKEIPKTDGGVTVKTTSPVASPKKQQEKDTIDVSSLTREALEKLGVDWDMLENVIDDWKRMTQDNSISHKIAETFVPPTSLKAPSAGVTLVSIHPILPDTTSVGSINHLIYVPDKVNPKNKLSDIDGIEPDYAMDLEAVLKPPSLLFINSGKEETGYDDEAMNQTSYHHGAVKNKDQRERIYGFRRHNTGNIMRPVGEFHLTSNAATIKDPSQKDDLSPSYTVVSKKTFPKPLEPYYVHGVSKDRLTIVPRAGNRNNDPNDVWAETANRLLQHGLYLSKGQKVGDDDVNMEDTADIPEPILISGRAWKSIVDADTNPVPHLGFPSSLLYPKKRQAPVRRRKSDRWQDEEEDEDLDMEDDQDLEEEEEVYSDSIDEEQSDDNSPLIDNKRLNNNSNTSTTSTDNNINDNKRNQISKDEVEYEEYEYEYEEDNDVVSNKSEEGSNINNNEEGSKDDNGSGDENSVNAVEEDDKINKDQERHNTEDSQSHKSEGRSVVSGSEEVESDHDNNEKDATNGNNNTVNEGNAEEEEEGSYEDDSVSEEKQQEPSETGVATATDSVKQGEDKERDTNDDKYSSSSSYEEDKAHNSGGGDSSDSNSASDKNNTVATSGGGVVVAEEEEEEEGDDEYTDGSESVDGNDKEVESSK